jgi:hypothetical protein
MGQTRRNIISASRRTDIPGWYTPWFLEQIHQGTFSIRNPYNKVVRTVDARPENVHSIVFWSKNFAPFLNLRADQILTQRGYPLHFNFTINSRSQLLEPNLPDLSARLDQARLLCERFGPDSLSWRFDPICFYKIDTQALKNTLGDITLIADALALIGITRCVTSVYDGYKTVLTRASYLSSRGTPRVCFVDPTPKDTLKIIQRMADYLKQKKITLHLCCEAELFKSLGENTTVKQNACIDGKLLKRLHGGTPETRPDYGQRTRQGCHCTKAIDIGSYEAHPCFHNCLFCYANTGVDTQIRQGSHDKNKIS